MIQIKKVQLTIPQMIFDLAKQPKKYFEGGRGAGKSTLIGKRVRDIAVFLPRSSNALVGSTYSQILSRTLPSTVEGLEMFGLFQDVDFVVGRCGKKLGYEMPYQPPSGPMGWNNIIHFSNGSIFQLVSLDNPNSGRGLNSSTITADEAALLDQEKLYINVKATNRVSKAALYKNHYLIGSESYYSSTPLNKKGKWFVEMEKKAKENPKKYFFLKASSLSNPYLRKEWFAEMKDECPSELIYNAEILNIRPKEITDGFYANLIPEKHYYTDYNNTYLETIGVTSKKEHFNCNQDNDVEVHRPLIVSLDFGVFNCVVVSQLQDDKYKILNSFHVKSPKLLDDLFIEQFIPYYQPHQEKIVYLYGGHDGNNRLPNHSKTLFEQVEDLLRQHGWKVHRMSKGAAATHADKYLLINAMLKGNASLPKIQINEHNNKDLIFSLEHAEAREGRNGVEKNKSSERNASILQQHATHLSDAFDIPIITMFNDKFKGKNSFISEFKIKT
jgi:hypothetical protein